MTLQVHLGKKEYTSIRVNGLIKMLLLRETERPRGSEVDNVTALKAKLTSRLKSRDRRC